jgi:archaeal flagellin FlaB
MNFTKTSMGMIGVGTVILLLLLSSPRQAKPPRGMAGIGTLIIFIAVILVAAIAAAVMITSSGSLQQKALITSNEAKDGVSMGLEAVSIRGSDASQSGTPHSVTHISLMGRLPAGSNPLSFNTTVLTLDTTQGAQSFLYGGTVSDSATAAGTSDYVVSYVKEGPYHEDGYANLGDMVKVKFNVNGAMGENTRGRVSIIPRAGNMNQLEFVTPETMTESEVVLWPMT